MKKKTSFLSSIFIFAFIFLIISMVATLARGVSLKDFALVHGSDYIYDDKSSIQLSEGNGVNVEVKQFGKLKEVTAKVYAIADKENDFIFSYGNQEHSWNEEVAGRDVTELLKLTVTQATEEDNAKVDLCGSVLDVLYEVSYGQEVTFEVAPEHALFRLEVYSGEEVISVSLLQLEFKATAFELSEGVIIF